MAIEVAPALEGLKALGINVKDWLIATAKSKTMWFAGAVAVFGALETYLPQMQGMIPDGWYGPIFTVVGVITGLLRFATKEAIADKKPAG
jgi:hypothetical protein